MKRLEAITNVAVLSLVLLLTGVVVKEHLLARPRQTTPAIGSRLSLPGDAPPRAGQRTLVMALQVGCHFCSDSAAFYRRVLQTTARSNVDVVAVLPQPVGEARDYLKSLGVDVGDVRQASPSRLGISGTPTLLLLDQEGRVTHSWRGKLLQENEDAVLEVLLGAPR